MTPISKLPPHHAGGVSSSGDLMLFVGEPVEGRTTLELYGELDIASTRMLDSELANAQRSRHLTVDLSGLRFMDSSGLRSLLLAKSRCGEADCQLSLFRGPREVQSVFELTDTLDAFSFED